MDSHSSTAQNLNRHDDVLHATRAIGSETNVGKVARRFVAGLRPADFPGWSALVSYAVASSVPEHPFSGNGRRCSVCGIFRDLDVYDEKSYADLRGGGGFLIQSLRYIVYDLHLFRTEADAVPTAENQERFDAVIRTLVDLPLGSSTKVADRELKIYFPSSFDRRVFLGTLGVCGVMASPRHPGLWPHFVDYKDRPDVDPGVFSVPVCFWNRDFGISLGALRHFELAQFLSPETTRLLGGS